jgi:uncharacterized small protein (DUF1192 family)
MTDRLEQIKELNRKRASRYYDNHKVEISNRRKELRKSDTPPPKTHIVEEPYSKSVVNKIKDEIAILNQEIEKLKKEAKQSKTTTTATATTAPQPQITIKHFTYSLEEVIGLMKENIESESSQKAYINSAKQLYDILGTDNILKALKKRFKDVIYQIETTSKKNDETKKYSTNSTKGFFQAIHKIVQLYPNFPISKNAKEAYDDKYKEYDQKSRIDSENKKATLELLHFEDYSDMVKEKFGASSKQFLIVSIYRINTFRDDLGELRIVDTKPKVMNDKKNYILVPRNKSQNISILLNDYKTVKKYGKEVINFSKQASKLTREYIENNDREYDDYLFPSKSLSSYVSKFNKELGLEKYTINTIRKMKISTALNSEEAMNDPKIRLQVAKEAHHNPKTSSGVYLHKTKKRGT